MVSNDVSSKSCIFILRTQEMASCQCEYLFQVPSHYKITIKVLMETINLILSVIGILVSGFGLYYAIRQVQGLQSITKEYQEQVKQEVASAQNNIREGLYISEITLCIKNLESAIKYVRESKIEMALLRMEDIETTLNNNALADKYLDINNRLKFKNALEDYKDSLKSIIKNGDDETKLNKDFVLETLSTIKSYLSIIDNSLKNTLYGKGS